MLFGEEKLEWCGCPTVKKFWRYVNSFWQNVRMWQTDRQTPSDSIGCACKALHGKIDDETVSVVVVRERRWWPHCYNCWIHRPLCPDRPHPAAAHRRSQRLLQLDRFLLTNWSRRTAPLSGLWLLVSLHLWVEMLRSWHILLGPDFRKILGRSYENLRKFLRLMKILGKTYDNADFRKILRKT